MPIKLLVSQFFSIAIFASIGGFVCTHSMAGERKDDSTEMVDTYVPWSSRVQRVLEREAEKFDYISDFYSFGYAWEDISLREDWFTFLIFFTGYWVTYPIFSQSLSWRFVLIRGVASLFFLLLWGGKLLNTYALRSKKGYFFLTDRGVLIVAPGKRGESIWLAYEQIAAVEVLVYPRNILPQRYLRITDSGGGERDYDYRRFASLFVFRELYTQLIAALKKSRALRHKSSVGLKRKR